jgi:hypothetical protein
MTIREGAFVLFVFFVVKGGHRFGQASAGKAEGQANLSAVVAWAAVGVRWVSRISPE